MNILYYDCFAGISGDMHLGAMIDAGVDPEFLIKELKKLPLEGYSLNICRDQRKSIEGTRVDVVLDDPDPNAHTHPHAHTHHHHDHDHRNLHDIESIIMKSTLPEKTKERAMKMFRLIAEAEAKIHGMPVSKVHFHEVGAIDSIVDITGAAICLEYLKPDLILSSPVELGSGTVRCAHGIMPVPAPATMEILKNIPVTLGSTDHEATTPTGAAIIAANVDEFRKRPDFIPKKTAYGIGQRDPEFPNILRVITGRSSETQPDAETCVLLECNIDDMNPEYYDHILSELFTEGAIDVYMTSVMMKKGRPGVLLSVLSPVQKKEALTRLLLLHTTTLGVRYQTLSRTVLHREMQTYETSLGAVRVKKSSFGDEIIRWKPEYEDCKAIASEKKMPVSRVHQIITAELEKKLHP
ncbi:nickel pincer cofactor biosynthesis protein LarC [Balneolaceae bacterium ANBcel3]|nr:nickel pincer cofactor biosynthesis protein LarC [Balneolaceae bacterium ANBcel3]